MSLSLIVVSLGAVVAAVGTGVLVARCVRSPRAPYPAWAAALFGLAVALGSQMIGDLAGYDSVMFRAMELGAQMVAPLALCLGLADMVGRSVPVRFAMRLAVSAIAVIALVVLGTDPLSQNVAFSTTWPAPALYYQLAPKAVLQFLALFTFVTAAVAAIVMTDRSRHKAASAAQPVACACAAAALLAVPGLAMLALSTAHVSLPLLGRSVFALACTGAAGLTWLAGTAAARLDKAGARARAGAARHDGDWLDERGREDDEPYQAGEFDRFDAVRPGDDRRGAVHRDEAVHDWGDPAEEPLGGSGGQLRYPGLAALAAEAGEQPARPRRIGEVDGDLYDDPNPLAGGYGETGRGRFDATGEYGEADGDRYGQAARYGGAEQYDAGRLGDAGRGGYPGGDPYSGDPHATLFGQITIYTLIEDRTGEFDRLTERIVAQVKDQEPGTLAYIVHAVPTAPMQRILYEVYRDRVAYEDHLRQPYIARYEAERRPFVLATNVIELGLQQAKVSAFPSFSTISDILSESGIDLTGVTRSPRGTGPAPRPGPGHSRLAPPVPPPSPQGDRWPDSRPAGDPGHQRQYQGWDEIRGEDQRYQ
jgi:quinol monooxygenase YgiN